MPSLPDATLHRVLAGGVCYAANCLKGCSHDVVSQALQIELQGRRPRQRLVSLLRRYLAAPEPSLLDILSVGDYAASMGDDEAAAKRGAQPGNQNAAKEADELLDAALNLKVKTAEKNAWVKKAQKAGMKLAPWVRQRLNEAE